MENKQLEEPEHYLNKESGDLYIIWYIENRPIGKDWVKISRKCYDIITRSLNK
jgi:hypothetical protein